MSEVSMRDGRPWRAPVWSAFAGLSMALAAAGGARADVLKALAPDALVVVGRDAPAAERAAAERLAEALQKAGAGEGVLAGADGINTDIERAAKHHLLVVGTGRSNRVLQRFASHWALDRDRFYAGRKPYEPWMPTTGYVAAGYGEWPAGATVGFVEWVRNPYWHYATNLLEEWERHPPRRRRGEPAPAEPPKLPYRQMVRLTGSNSAGVKLAVEALLERRLLTGAVTPDGRMPGPMTLWAIDDAHHASPAEAPGWIPRTPMKRGSLSLTLAGWHLADAATYAGFRQVAGRGARRIWRAKYLTEVGWDWPMHVVADPAHPMTRSPLFNATMARRASDHELLVARMASPVDAVAAVKAVRANLSKRREHSHAPWSEVRVGAVTWQRSRFGFHAAAAGAFVVFESFDAEHEGMVLEAVAAGLGGKRAEEGGP